MTLPTYDADGVRLYVGDCREVMAALPVESVSCCVTSPPFWGLRKYDGPDTIWGGDPDCPHVLPDSGVQGESYGGRQRWQHDGVSRQETPEAWVKAPVHVADRQHLKELGERDGSHGGVLASSRVMKTGGHATCSLCGAWRGQMGREPTVEMFVAHTLEWLREVKRVLRKDGVFFLDIGDSRAAMNRSARKESPGVGATQEREAIPMKVKWKAGGGSNFAWETPEGIKPKSLCLIPDRIRLAALADGWIVRDKIIIKTWMPESAKDRCTKQYRELIMLVKSGRYWSDFQAVRVATTGQDGTAANFARLTADHVGPAQSVAQHRLERTPTTDNGLRNLGNLWDDLPPSSSALPGEHFASFPVAEAERCIRASCPPDGTVLDPFVGTGTTCVAARKLGRKSIGIDVSEHYIAQAIKRLTLGDKAMRRLAEARKQGAEQATLL